MKHIQKAAQYLGFKNDHIKELATPLYHQKAALDV